MQMHIVAVLLKQICFLKQKEILLIKINIPNPEYSFKLFHNFMFP